MQYSPLTILPTAVATCRHGQRCGEGEVKSGGDLLSTLPPQRRFDFVVSNPPYVSSDEMTALARDVRQFEPREALEAGPRGSEVIERLIPQAAQQLVRGGWLLLEISHGSHEVVDRQIAEFARQVNEPDAG